MERNIERHLVAAIGYRAGFAFRQAPPEFMAFQAGEGVRTPIEMVNHMNAVLTKAARAFGVNCEDSGTPLSGEAEISRFFELLEEIDVAMETGAEPLTMTLEQIMQGPLADVLTHIGQLYMLRRLSGSPVSNPGSFIQADISIGRIQY
ncbi:hypothetical protein V1498_09280 [Peribacillus sp. SCS-26]|uniref:hypothetical protein n=1 Tax=Paraperibacillus marinus TaxID=3115295 RepID=UPI003905ACB5